MTDYSRLSFDQIRRLRDAYPDNSTMQAQLAPYEHQAFAREWTQDNPMVAAPSLAVAIPGYALAKLLGMSHGRTQPSWEQVVGGYRGIGQGLMGLMQGGSGKP